jgi:hypothetical protein
MLQLHAQAVEHGFIWVEPISEADAQSLRDRLYRIRRRSDKSMAAFIPPEYHLVMVGRWEPGEAGTGRLPLIYNARADGKPLPSIRIADGSEAEAYLKPPALANPPALDISNIEIKPEEISSLVERLRKSAKERGND